MNFIKIILLNVFLLLSVKSLAQVGIRRYWGLHYDFHATEKDVHVGEENNYSTLSEIIRVASPEYIQIDTKGHPGFSSYPTKIGVTTNAIRYDPLSAYRNITSRAKVLLFAHYSSLLDKQQVKMHPNWAKIDYQGKPSTNEISLQSNYVKKLFLPQVRELIKKYQFDGLWVDGDSWSVRPDFSSASQVIFKSKYRSNMLDPSTSTSAIAKFTIDTYNNYFRSYVDSIHAINMGVLVGSNWAYSSRMPGRMVAKVDFLTGDLSDQDPVLQAMVESRIFAAQNLPWDLMSWGFYNGSKPKKFKDILKLKLEASEILSQGGGFSLYYPQERNGSISATHIDELASLGLFCLSRKPYCFQTKPVPQVALLLSEIGSRSLNSYPFSENRSGSKELRNTLFELVNSGYSVQILQDHQFNNQMPVYVITEWDSISKPVLMQLRNYINNGGLVFVQGARSERQLKNVLYLDKTRSEEIANLVSIGKGKIYFASSLDPKEITKALLSSYHPLVEFENPTSGLHLSLTSKGSAILVNLIDVRGTGSPGPIILKLSKELTFKTATLQPSNERLNIAINNGYRYIRINEINDTYNILELR